MKRIMIVDDEASVRQVISHFLKMKGYDVATVENGALALARLGSYQPDLVLLDNNMPGMDGLEVIKRMKKQQPDVSIIMLTGLAEEEIGETAMQNGALDFLTKPIALDHLETTLSVHLLMGES